MKSIPSGKLATYGQISLKLEQRTGHCVSPRTIGWLRKSLYEIYRSDGVGPAQRSIPLHRIAVKGDISSARDSEKTRLENEAIRSVEGFSASAPWVVEEEW
jgi:alkylated DNA nucleotide flippase Atl1